MLFQFWAILERRQRLLFGGFLIAALVNAASEFISLGAVFALAISVIAPKDSFPAQSLIAHLIGPTVAASGRTKGMLAIVVLCAFLLKGVTSLATVWVRARIINRQTVILSDRMFRNFMAEGWPFFLENNVAVSTAKIMGTCMNFTQEFIAGMATVVTELLVCLALFAGLAMVSPQAMLIVSTALATLIAILWLATRRWVYRFGRRAWDAKADAIRTVDTALHGAREVILYRRIDAFSDRLTADLERSGRAGVVAQVLSSCPRQVIEMCAVVGLIGFFALESASGRSWASIAVVASVFGAAGVRLLPAASRLASAGAIVASIRPYFDQLRPHLTPIPPRPVAAIAEASQPLVFEEAIDLRSISFRYPTAAGDALTDISVRIPKGRSLGIVGRSGAGKTTLVQILLGFLVPTEGQVLVDGRPLDLASANPWRDMISYVPQDTFLSDDTLARNIAFGLPDAEIDPERVREAAGLANIAEFIETRTSSGYETVIGERGVILSGGQRQRVVIARALYRRPRILVFDEATSALDQIAETVINEAVARLEGERTVVVVANRLSAVRHCSEIIALEHGRLVQRGAFADLARDAGVFRDLHRAMEGAPAEAALS